MSTALTPLRRAAVVAAVLLGALGATFAAQSPVHAIGVGHPGSCQAADQDGNRVCPSR
ncbi:hypothetical protein ABZ078_09655 [Streptomyces sp. NPDC006385]|uniref:hypothetical protein n=1 Tax=Streptomyces sp. NPDC006385 TaxID=3156761 RepID=UPI0033A6A25A